MGLSNNRSNIVEPPKGKGDRKEFDYGEERKSAYVVQKTTKCEIDRGKRTQDHITDKTTKDKQNAAIREYLASKADFVGAIRLPSDAFKREGTAVVTDIIFLHKRAPGAPARHDEAEWERSRPFEIGGTEVS